MKIVTYLDNDEINHPGPATRRETIHSLAAFKSASVEQLAKDYPGVFGEGVGQLAGIYHIQLDPEIQHALWHVLVTVRDWLKEKWSSKTSLRQSPSQWSGSA